MANTLTVDLDALQTVLNKLNEIVTDAGIISGDLSTVNSTLPGAVSGTGTVAATISTFDSDLATALTTVNNLSTVTLQPMITKLQQVWNDANDAATVQL